MLFSASALLFNLNIRSSYLRIVRNFSFTLKLQDEVTPLSKGRALVRFVHVGGTVMDNITVKANKSVQYDLSPYSKYNYHKFDAKK